MSVKIVKMSPYVTFLIKFVYMPVILFILNPRYEEINHFI